MTVDGPTIKSRIRNLLRSPSIKLRKNRKESLANTVTLERVLGITTSGNSGLTCDPCSGLVAYPAGCAVVLLNPKNNQQHHILNSSRKAITALSFSPDGKYLVTGESGHLPAVRVWDMAEGRQVAELQEHKYGVSCAVFSPDSKHVVSVGYQHDMTVSVWAWKKDTVIAANKVSSKVTGVSFSEDSSYFVTAGNRHVKFWYLDLSKPAKAGAKVPLLGRSALLGELKNNFFCDVACGRGSRADATFCITSSGLLCELGAARTLDKWVDLRTSVAHSLCVSEDLIFCGCAEGTVRAFNPSDLRFVCTLPRPHPLGADASAVTQASHLFSNKTDARYPDCVAVTYDPVSRRLSCVYNDHSLYVWDVRDLHRVGRVHSALYHASCVWDLQVLPEGAVSDLSSGTFLSCSEDNTVRLWSVDGVRRSQTRSVLSSDLLKVIYVDGNTAALLDTEGSGARETGDGQTAEARTGVRTICVSPDGRHLASGDRSGMLRVHDLSSMEEILKVEAHDSEILCLEYSKPDTGLKLLATAGRDRLIHILDAEEHYGLVQTLDEHSSSISAVRFAANEDRVRMISCGADKSIYFRTAHRTDRGTEFRCSHHVASKTTLYDMTVDPICKYAAVGCQDRRIRVFNISSGKQKKLFKGSQTEDGSVLRVQTDPSGLYVATSCTDKNISIFHFLSGECVATMSGHSEIVTGMKFTNDCKHLISVSGDSCIFVWRLASEMTASMRERLTQLGRIPETPPYKTSSLRREMSSVSVQGSASSGSDHEEEEEPEQEDSHDQEEKAASTGSNSSHDREEDTAASDEGPDWASASKTDGCSGPVAPEAPAPARPRRRWSRRIGSLELTVKSMLELRQLDAPSVPGSSHRRASSSQLSSLQGAQELEERAKRSWLRPLSKCLSSAKPRASQGADGNVLYPEASDDRTSLQGSDYLVNGSLDGGGRGQEPQHSQSPDSACSVDYDSRQSSPDRAHDDSEGVEPLSSDDDWSDLEDEAEQEEEEEEEEERGKMEVTSMDEAMRMVTATPEPSPQTKQNFRNLIFEPDSTDSEGNSRTQILSMSACFLARGSTNRRTPLSAKVPEREPGPAGPSAQPLVSKVRPLMELGQGKNNPGDRSPVSPRPERTKVEEGVPGRGPVPRPHSQRRRRLPGAFLWRTSSPLTRASADQAAGPRNSQSGLRPPTPFSYGGAACPGDPPVDRDPSGGPPPPSRPLSSRTASPSSSPAPRSPPPWDGPGRRSARSYMSPTASSEAKTGPAGRSSSRGEDLHLGTPPSRSPLPPGDGDSPRRRGRRWSSLPEAQPPLLSSAPASRSLNSLCSSPSSSPSCRRKAGASPSPVASPNRNPSSPPNFPPSRIPLRKQPTSPRRSLGLETRMLSDWLTVTAAASSDPVCDRAAASVCKPDQALGHLGSLQPVSVSATSLPVKQEGISESESAMLPGQEGCKDRPLVSVQPHTLSTSTPQQEPSVTVQNCRQAAAELRSSLRKTSQLYTMVLDSDAGESRQEMKRVLDEALGLVRAELDSVPQPAASAEVREGGWLGVKGEGERTALALLEQYSELLLKSVEKRLESKT